LFVHHRFLVSPKPEKIIGGAASFRKTRALLETISHYSFLPSAIRLGIGTELRVSELEEGKEEYWIFSSILGLLSNLGVF
jgi:hypothetical protein